MSQTAPSMGAMRNRLKLRLALYGCGTVAAICIIFGMLGEATTIPHLVVRALCCVLIFLTIHEDMELSWGYKIWKGHVLPIALFASLLAIFYFAPAAYQNEVLMVPVLMYLSFAALTVYKNLTGSDYYHLYPILQVRKSKR